MEPGGRAVAVFAASGVELTSTSARTVRTEAAIQPDGRRKDFGIVQALTSGVDFGLFRGNFVLNLEIAVDSIKCSLPLADSRDSGI
jgi:hypothetical protein